jgi:hypothetical protein
MPPTSTIRTPYRSIKHTFVALVVVVEAAVVSGSEAVCPTPALRWTIALVVVGLTDRLTDWLTG